MQIKRARDTFLEMYFLPDHDDAFMGVARDNQGEYVAVYDYDKIIKRLQQRDGSTHYEAVEWIEYNLIGSNKLIFIE